MIEKVVLVVDDQFGDKDDPMIQERYGNNQVTGYRFELEDAVDHYEPKPSIWDKSKIVDTPIYSANKVVDRIRSLNPDIVLLDLNFGLQRGYGLEIMRYIRDSKIETPVLMHSSADTDRELKLIDECIKSGAREAIPKLPTPQMMNAYLDKYVGGVN